MITILIENTYFQLLIVGLISVSIYFLLTRRPQRQVKLYEPPIVDYRFPIIGHTWSYLTDCKNFIVESQKKYGEMYSIYVFGRIMTIVGKESAYEVYKRDLDFDIDRNPTVKAFIDYAFPEAAKKNDKVVKIIRGFFKAKFNVFTDSMQQTIIKDMDKYIGECNEPKIISNIHEITLSVVSAAAANVLVEEFGNCEDVLDYFKNLYYTIRKAAFEPKLSSFIQVTTHSLKYILNHTKAITSHIRPIVEDRFHKMKLDSSWVAPPDALQFLLNDPEVAPDLDPNNVDYNFIADTINFFIFTTLISIPSRIVFVIYDLARRKEYLQELRQEAQEIHKQCNGNLDYTYVDKMVKLDNFIKESFRLNSDLISVPRACTTESHYTFANGYQVPNGRLVALNIKDVNYNEEHYQNPNEFNADRYNSSMTKIERDFLVFGFGKHSCPGRVYAIAFFKLILYQILLKYNIKLESENVNPINYVGYIAEPCKFDIVFENSA